MTEETRAETQASGTGTATGTGSRTIGGSASGGPLTGGLQSVTTGNSTLPSPKTAGMPGTGDDAPGNPSETDLSSNAPLGGGKAAPGGVAMPDKEDNLSGVLPDDAEPKRPAIGETASGEEDGAPTGGLMGSV